MDGAGTLATHPNTDAGCTPSLPPVHNTVDHVTDSTRMLTSPHLPPETLKGSRSLTDGRKVILTAREGSILVTVDALRESRLAVTCMAKAAIEDIAQRTIP